MVHNIVSLHLVDDWRCRSWTRATVGLTVVGRDRTRSGTQHLPSPAAPAVRLEKFFGLRRPRAITPGPSIHSVSAGSARVRGRRSVFHEKGLVPTLPGTLSASSRQVCLQRFGSGRSKRHDAGGRTPWSQSPSTACVGRVRRFLRSRCARPAGRPSAGGCAGGRPSRRRRWTPPLPFWPSTPPWLPPAGRPARGRAGGRGRARRTAR